MNKLSIIYTPIAMSLSSISGLKVFDDMISKFEFKNLFGMHLSKKERTGGFSSWNKFYALILGLIAGFDCLDDFDWFCGVPLFSKLTGTPSAITLGRFLRQFSFRKIEILQNECLPQLGFTIRKILDPKVHKIILTMDSSDHEQYGVKSEDVDFGYRKFRCLNSQYIFDDKGICYGFKLRKGNTHSSVDAPEMLYQTLKGFAGGRSFLRVVFIRTKNLTPTKEDKYPYHYYAVVTDISESEMSSEHVLKFYQKRSQIENNIKDIKNGMDFHHFPCTSLKTNNVWGFIGVIAYNLRRYASFAIKENEFRNGRCKSLEVGKILRHQDIVL